MPLLLAAMGCVGPEPDASAAWRWIEEPPSRLLSRTDLLETECVREFEFDRLGLPEGVELVSGELEGGREIVIRGGDAPPRLRWTVPVRGADLSSVQLTVKGLRRGDVRILWSEPGSDSIAELVVPRTQGAGAWRDRFLADLSGRLDPEREYWLELEPTTVAGELVTLGEVCLGRTILSEEALRSLAGAPWKVTRGGESRDCLLVPPSGSVTRTGAVAADARLEFGVARLYGGGQGVRLELASRVGDGPVEVLWSRRYEGPELDVGFVDEIVGLSEVAGRETQLTLRVRSESEEPAAVVLSAPRVRTGRRSSARPNVILVSLDTLRADHLSLYGYERPTSPRLDRWARNEATVFTKAYAPSGWTLPSHFSLFTGLEAHHHPANYNNIAFDVSAYSFLAAELWKAGYSTDAVTGGVFVHPDYGLATGFERFRFWQWRDRLGEETEATFRAARDFVAGAPQEPFLLFVHTYEVHAPNPPREPYYGELTGRSDRGVVDYVPIPPDPARAFRGNQRVVVRDPATGRERAPSAEDRQSAIDAYDSAIAYLDERLGAMLEQVDASSFSRNTVIVLFSDHGESLGEDDRFGHANLELANLRIPLIVRLPDRHEAGRSIDEQVRLHDVFATVLELAGIDVPRNSDSRSLLELFSAGPRRGRPAHAYAASTNHGLARIDPDGIRVDWHNTAWLPVSGAVRWSRVRDFETEPLAGPPDDAGSGALRLLEADYSARSPGLRLKVENRTGQRVALVLETDLVDPVGVKVPRLGVRGFEWRDVGRLEGEIEPRGRIELHFERISSDRVSLAVRSRPQRCDAAVERELSARIRELRSPRRWSVRLPDCSGEPGGEIELDLSWIGPPPRHTVSPDAELSEALKALGYL